MDPKSSELVKKAGIQSADNPLEFVLSNESVDRMGDVIRSAGWQLDDFKASPVCLFGHDHEKIIGTWKNVRIVGRQLIGELRLAKEGTSEFIDTIRSLVEQRIIRACSVGFQPIEAKQRKSGEGYDFIKSSLHEVSLCAVPANPQALAIAKSFCKSPEIAEKLFAPSSYQPGDEGIGQVTVKTPNLETARARMKALGITAH